LRGEVAVRFTSNRPERAAPGSELYAGDRALVIVTARSHQDRVLVRFDGIDDRTAAEALQGLELSGDPLTGDAAELDDRELWVHDVVGAQVRDRSGTVLGTVTAVEANPAHDLLVLDGGALVPMVFVVEHGDGVVVVDPPEGLFEL
jgi:16S rRNA processing protein RimM